MKPLRIGITHGDINGISYELLVKVLQSPELLDFCTPVIFGSAAVAQATAQQLGLEPLPLCVVASAAEALDGRINLVPVCKDAEPVLQFGQQTEEALQAEAQSITVALEAAAHHHIDVLVTLPGHLDNDDQSHALTDLILRAFESQAESFAWVCNGQVRTLLLPAVDASTELGEGLAHEAFQRQVTAISDHLRCDFASLRPRLAVISSNARLASPIAELREHGLFVFGPFEARSFVERGLQHHYDGCILLGADEVRDQLLADAEPEYTVGYVSGLPIVHTYPHLPISYERAGQGVTSEVPLREAIYAAIDIERARRRYRQATRRPLEKQWIPRGRDDFKLDLTRED